MDLSMYDDSLTNTGSDIESYIKSKNPGFIGLLSKLGLARCLVPKPGKTGITILIPDVELTEKLCKMVKDGDYGPATTFASDLILQDYLPRARDFREKQDDIPTLNNTKLCLSKIRGSIVVLRGGAELSPCNDVNRKGIAAWCMKGEYDSTGCGMAEHKYNVTGSKGKTNTTYALRLQMFNKMVTQYCDHVADSTKPNPCLLYIASMIDYVQQNYDYLVRRSPDMPSPLQLLHMVKSPCPEAFFLSALEPGKKNLINPVFTDEMLLAWNGRAGVVDKPRSILEKFLDDRCDGDGLICTDDGKMRIETARYMLQGELVKTMSVTDSPSMLMNQAVLFEKANSIGQLEGVEPHHAHEYLYGCCPGRKGFFDETIFTLSRSMEKAASELNTKRRCSEVHRIFNAYLLRAKAPSYRSGSWIFNPDHWKKQKISSIEAFVSAHNNFIKGGLFLYEAMPKEVVVARGASSTTGIPIQRSSNIELELWNRLLKMQDPGVILSPACAAQIEIWERAQKGSA